MRSIIGDAANQFNPGANPVSEIIHAMLFRRIGKEAGIQY
jgi:hypothetical protein